MKTRDCEYCRSTGRTEAGDVCLFCGGQGYVLKEQHAPPADGCRDEGKVQLTIADLELWRKAGVGHEARRWELLSDTGDKEPDGVICRLHWNQNGRECGVGMRDKNHVAAVIEALRRFNQMHKPPGDA